MGEGIGKIGSSIPTDIDVSDPNSSFNDDDVGAKRAAQDAAKSRAASQVRPKNAQARLTRSQRKVHQADTFETFESSEEEGAARRLARAREAGDSTLAETLPEAATAELKGQALASLVRHQQQISQLMHEIFALMQQVDLLGGLDAMEEASRQVFDREGQIERGERRGSVGRLAANVAKLANLKAKLDRAEFDLKQQLQLLLAGTTGLVMLSDPQLTFKKLLARIRRWPRRIAPGRRPDSQAEFDAFIAWVFAPPASPYNDPEEAALHLW